MGTRVEVISHLMPRHAVAMTCITLGDQTHLTLTWDESRLERASVAGLGDDLLAQRDAIEAELASG